MDSVAASVAPISPLNRTQGLPGDATVNKVSQPSNTSTPHSGLITLEALRAAAEGVRLNMDGYRLRVSIVSADPVPAMLHNGRVAQRVNGQDVEQAL